MVEQLLACGRHLGAPGLFAMGLIDSGGIPTGGGPDLLLAMLVVDHASVGVTLLMTTAAVLGSILGCLVMYAIGRYGGTPVLARFGAKRVERASARLHRHGFLAIVVAVVAPPPYPMKLFILSAGAFRLSIHQFVAAVAVGRSMRYLSVGLMALYHGDAMWAHVSQHGPLWAFIAGALLVGLLVGRWLLRRRQAPADPERD